MILFNYRKRLNLQTHPIYKKISLFGSVEEINDSITKEISQRSINLRSTIITKNWIIQKSIFSTDLIKINEIIWIYKKHKTKKVNLETVSEQYSAVILTEKGQNISIYGEEYQVNLGMAF